MKKEQPNNKIIYEKKYKRYKAASSATFAAAIISFALHLVSSVSIINSINNLKQKNTDSIHNFVFAEIEANNLNPDNILNDDAAIALSGYGDLSISKEKFYKLLENKVIRDEIYSLAKEQIETKNISKEEFIKLLQDEEIKDFIYSYVKEHANKETIEALESLKNLTPATDTINKTIVITTIVPLVILGLSLVFSIKEERFFNAFIKEKRFFNALNNVNEELDKQNQKSEKQNQNEELEK